MSGSVVPVVAALALSGCGSGIQSEKGSRNAHVEFIVTGSAPNGVRITYGDDSSNRQVRRLPLDVTMSIKTNTLYWVMAQLQGSGRITCKVVIGNKVRASHAAGGFNTCTAQSPSDPLSGWN